MTDLDGLTDRIKAQARNLGFDLVGVAPAVVPPGYGRYLDWLDHGREAGMAYLRRHAEAKGHPKHILEGVRSVIVAGMIYGHSDPTPPTPTQGRVARYARGDDYHEILWRRLEALLDWLRGVSPGVVGRAACDTAPLLERDFAKMAGLGWIGKNTCLIDRRAGSFTVLGSLLVDVELAYDAPIEANYCGTCTRCLDACPTHAFDGPYQLDARKCISYWTIEHKGPIPDPVAEGLDGWVFGCDVCQDVCPWNRKAPAGRQPGLDPKPSLINPGLLDWLAQEASSFSKSLKGTALARSKRSGLLRNAALILGTRRVVEAVPVLIERLSDLDPVVRDASAWALGRIGSTIALPALRQAAEGANPLERAMIDRAIEQIERDE